MSSWALLGGLMGGAQAAQTLLLNYANQKQKDKDRADEEALWMKRQYLMESMKAPAEKVETMDDPDNPGHKIAVTKQWNPPTKDGERGSYQEVARVHVPVKWEVKKIGVGNDTEQDMLVDPDNPSNTKPFPGSTPQPRHDPSAQARLGIEGGNLSVSQQRLKLEQDKFAADQADKNDPKKRAALMPFEPIMEEDAATGAKTHMRFDRRTGTMGPPPTYHAPGISDIQATGDASPLSQLSPNTGGAGSGGTMSPGQAKGASTKGPPVAKKIINGVMWYKFSDGSTAPAS